MDNRLPALALAAVLLLSATLPAAAQETQPGDACTAGELHHMRQAAGPENPGTGYFLVCDGANWKLITEWDTATGNSLFQVDYDAGACDALKEARLRYTSASKLWEYCDGANWASLGSASAATLNDLIDVNILSAADQEVLTYDSASGTWASAPSTVNILLDNVGDVNAPVPTAGQVLKWSGSAWIADTDEGGLSLWSDSGAGYIEYSLANTGIKVEATAAASPTFLGLSDLADHTANQNIRMSGFWLSNDGGDEGVFVDANGNVGIGTASPDALLHVAGELRASQLRPHIFNTNSDNYIIVHGQTTSSNAWLRFRRGGAAPSGASGLLLSSFGADHFFLEATGSDLGFHYSNQSSESPAFSNASEIVTIQGSGNVGIGTTGPSTRLTIDGGTDAALASGGYLTIGAATGANLVLDNNEIMARSNGIASPLYFQWDGGDALFGGNGGNVGIGATSPSSKLHVKGVTNDSAGGIMIESSNNDTERLALYPLGNSSAAIQLRNSGGLYFQNSTGGAMLMMQNSDGFVGIGTSSPGYKLHVNGTAYATGAAGALSDRRHKKAITDLPVSSLEAILRLRPVQYQWKDPKDLGMQGAQFGFIAQEVEKIVPQVVLTQDDAEQTKGLKYSALIPVLTKGIQELKAEKDQEVEALKADSAAMRAENAALKESIKTLEGVVERLDAGFEKLKEEQAQSELREAGKDARILTLRAELHASHMAVQDTIGAVQPLLELRRDYQRLREAYEGNRQELLAMLSEVKDIRARQGGACGLESLDFEPLKRLQGAGPPQEAWPGAVRPAGLSGREPAADAAH